MTKKPIHYGFQPSPLEKEHWHMGQGKARRTFGAASLMPGGHGWGAFKPVKEFQNTGYVEKMACTIFGTLNCYETLAKFYGFEDFPKDCADRFNAILAQITKQGGDIQNSCESIRKFAVIPQFKLPFDDTIRTWEQFYAPIPIPIDLILMAKRIADTFLLGHEWVFNGVSQDKQRKLMAALERGTVAVSMYAWRKKKNIYFKNPEDQDNHWLQVLDFVEGEYWLVYDHYEDVEKKIAWDTDFYCAKVYFLARRSDQANILVQLQRQVIYLMTQLVNLLKAPEAPVPVVIPSPAPMPEPIPEPTPVPVEKLLWDTPQQAYHSTRVVCDEVGLTFEQKEILCACVYQESGFKNYKAPGIPTTNGNKDKQGKVWSTDYGIAQVNDYWNIGPGKPFPSVSYVLNYPEEVIRWMAGIYKRTGKLTPWASFTSGAYKQWLKSTSPMRALQIK